MRGPAIEAGPPHAVCYTPFCFMHHQGERSALLILLFFLPLSLFAADNQFFNLFPQSPAIPGLSYSGQLAYSQTYTPSGSTWAPGLDEHEVFFAGLKHAESSDNSWEVRIGKGGQLYSIRGLFGESQAPQGQPNAHWIDQVFQFIGVNSALNGSTAGHAYFVHQAGDYLDDPILKSTFYSPMLANSFDAASNAAYALNWGQQAHIPDVNRSGLLYYERVKDLGSGVIELTYVVYNFGTDVIDYQDSPWGGVRKSVLPVTLGSNPDGSSKVISALFGAGTFYNLNASGGWIAWTQNATNPSSPALALVVGKDTLPLPSYEKAQGRIRYGTGPTQDDFEVAEVTPFFAQNPGSAYYFRVYLVAGALGKVQNLANTLAPYAARGPLTLTEDSVDLLPLYLQTANGQNTLTATPQADQSPALYTYAQPVPNSLPLFILRSTVTGQLRLSTDPYELCAPVPFGSNEVVYKPYDGTVQYAGFLGYVLPTQHAKSKAETYANLLDVVTDRSYLPSNVINATLKAVAARTTITSIGVAFGGSDIAQNTWIAIKGANLAPADLGPNGLTWSAAPEFANGKMPTQLDGVSVTVNGKPGYMFFVSAGQINVLTPLDGTLGPVQVQVTNGPNVSSPFTVNMKSIAPAFLLEGASTYILATHGDDGTLIGPASFSVPGYTYSPARPNETVVLYGVGCGLPSLPVIQGSSAQFGALPVTPSIQIGGSPANVAFGGLVSPGLCQFNVTVPASASGDSAVVLTIGSASTPLARIPVQP